MPRVNGFLTTHILGSWPLRPRMVKLRSYRLHILTMQSSQCDFTRQSARCDPTVIHAMQFSRCNPNAISRCNPQDAIPRCNSHNAIPRNDTIRTMRSYATMQSTRGNSHDAISRTMQSARCDPTQRYSEQSTRFDPTMQSAQCDLMPRCNPHDAISCNPHGAITQRLLRYISVYDDCFGLLVG